MAPPSDKGLRTRLPDDRIWLPFALAQDVEAPADRRVLAEQVGWLDAPVLTPDQGDSYQGLHRSPEPVRLCSCKVVHRRIALGPVQGGPQPLVKRDLPCSYFRSGRGLGPRSPRPPGGTVQRSGGGPSVGPEAEQQGAPKNGQCPVRTLLLPGGGRPRCHRRREQRVALSGDGVQPVGIRSELPSMRMVWQRCRMRSSSALTICFWPRKPYHSS